jgi:hypothetical protein
MRCGQNFQLVDRVFAFGPQINGPGIPSVGSTAQSTEAELISF